MTSRRALGRMGLVQAGNWAWNWGLTDPLGRSRPADGRNWNCLLWEMHVASAWRRSEVTGSGAKISISDSLEFCLYISRVIIDRFCNLTVCKTTETVTQ